MNTNRKKGFTLVELLIVIAVIGILASIAIAKYASTVRKTAEAATKGNLGVLRSAISIYSGDHEGVYPTDDLASLSQNRRYISEIPSTHAVSDHPETTLVTTETSVSDSGRWSYNNVESDDAWGTIHVGCTHQDYSNHTWSSF